MIACYTYRTGGTFVAHDVTTVLHTENSVIVAQTDGGVSLPRHELAVVTLREEMHDFTPTEIGPNYRGVESDGRARMF